MFNPLTPAHQEQRAFVVEQERAEAQRLLSERETNSVQLGRHFIRAKGALSKKEFGDYVRSLGLIPLTAEGFILHARKANGETPPEVKPRKRRDPEREVLEAIVKLADEMGSEAAIKRAKELLSA